MTNYDSQKREAIKEMIKDRNSRREALIEEHTVKCKEVGVLLAEQEFYEKMDNEEIAVQAGAAAKRAMREREEIEVNNNERIRQLDLEISILQNM